MAVTTVTLGEKCQATCTCKWRGTATDDLSTAMRESDHHAATVHNIHHNYGTQTPQHRR